MTFPLDRLEEVQQRPEDFRLLERVPFTRDSCPTTLRLNPTQGDEVPILILDVETNGLETDTCSIIELGLVRLAYSPSAQSITAITGQLSAYRDPRAPLPELITELTGITDEMVAGQSIPWVEVDRFCGGDPLVVAHNAPFDRKFMESTTFGADLFENLRWACSIQDIDWRGLGVNRTNLEYILTHHGYFYQAHRATIDCLAVAWVLHINPVALHQLVANAVQLTALIRAEGAPYHCRHALKAEGYRWDPVRKVWHRSIPEAQLEEEQHFLDGLYYNGGELADWELQAARERYKEAS